MDYVPVSNRYITKLCSLLNTETAKHRNTRSKSKSRFISQFSRINAGFYLNLSEILRGLEKG